MSTRIIRDPFTGKDVEISNRLTDRLRGKYACGPIMENGEPEFGWRQHEVPPIQIEAAAHIEQLEATLRRCRSVLGNMAMENEGAIFNRWPISHEPLRSDARGLLPVIDATLAPEQDK